MVPAGLATLVASEAVGCQKISKYPRNKKEGKVRGLFRYYKKNWIKIGKTDLICKPRGRDAYIK